MSEPRRFFGKYRGTVVDNRDPLRLGRLRALVPDVGGDVPGTWALPCLPAAAGDRLAAIAVPPVHARVWIEFEQGDPDHPIWVGCYWDERDDPGLPRERRGEAHLLLRVGDATLTLSDDPDRGLVLEAAGARLVLGKDGVELSDGAGASIRLRRGQIDLNDGALEVT